MAADIEQKPAGGSDRLQELIANALQALTGEMVTDMVVKAVKGMELADTLVQKGALRLAEGMVSALDQAVREREAAGKPPTLRQAASLLRDEEVREGLILFLTFAKALPGELRRHRDG